MCGENRQRQPLLLTVLGSPPRVRGKPKKSGKHPALYGITPACAGKTAGLWEVWKKRQDHPRVCGENKVGFYKSPFEQGSPPRVRGKPMIKKRFENGERITPACAGKTYWKRRTLYKFQDHPRVCGENLVILIPRHCEIGSPPRVRGKPTTGWSPLL